jgi:hypothetical protein
MRTSHLGRLWVLALLTSGCGGCSKNNPANAIDAGAANSGDGSIAGASGESGAEEDDVRPVYPVTGVTTNPLATRLCIALHEVPEKKRSTCCKEPPAPVVKGECERMLSAALNAKAVTIEPSAVDACVAAMDATYSGCDWVGPFPPDVPAACLGIVKGTLKAKDRCRSSLECGAGLRCHGVGPTTIGRCGAPREDGAGCSGGNVDTLVTFARQNDLDDTHPECKGYCDRIRCASWVAEGGACRNHRECGPEHSCVSEGQHSKDSARCMKRARAKLGEACSGDICESGLRCISGKCRPRLTAGTACERDFDCLGGCIKPDGGTKGLCGQKCGVR